MNQTSLWRGIALGAVALLPLAVAGATIGALGSSDANASRIPAAVVNADEMITTTADDGTESQMFAGRQLVTDLTSGDIDGFDWQISNADESEQMLADGEVYAVLTVPADFSQRVTSLSGDDPQQAGISIETDDAHDYLSPSIAAQVGETLASSFGDVVTTGFVSGVYSGMGTIGEQLGAAGDGATQIGDGGDTLATGLGDLASGATQIGDGIGQSQDGATQLADGASQLSGGLGTAATGIDQLSTGSSQLSDGVDAYTGGVDQLAGGLSQLASQSGQLADGATGLAGGLTQLQGQLGGQAEQAAQLRLGLQQIVDSLPDGDPTRTALEGVIAQLSTGASGGSADDLGALIDGLNGFGAGVAGIQTLADGATQLSGGSAGLRSGASGLADGLSQLDSGFGASVDGASQLSTGATQLADGLGQLQTAQTAIADGATSAQGGATQLADGAHELGSGLTDGAAQVPSLSDAEVDQLSDVASNPVGFEVSQQNAASSQAVRVATLAVPVALWVGALAILLMLTPATRRALASTASSGRLVAAFLGRAGLITAVQAVLVSVVLHITLGLDVSLLPATLGVALAASLVFTLVHTVLTLVWGRGGLVASLLLLAVQILSAGGIIPLQLVAAPFEAISPLLPMTHAVAAYQAVLTGGSAAAGWSAIAALAIMGVVLLLLSVAAVRFARRRQAMSTLHALSAEPA